jgi:hypothetical protein
MSKSKAADVGKASGVTPESAVCQFVCTGYKRKVVAKIIIN